MDRTEFIKLLMKFRMSRAGTATGMSEQVARIKAEEIVEKQVPDLLTAMGSPDGAIVSMVETYLSFVAPIVRGVFDVDNPPETPAFRAASTKAINEIEAHRGKIVQGEGSLSERFSDYVYYRIRLEIMHLHGIDSREMGLDSETVTLMVKTCIAALASKF